MEKKEIESILLINWYYIGSKLHEPRSVNTVFIGKYLNKRINRKFESSSLLKINNVFSILFIIAIRFRFLLILPLF
jgi:hypothetical protein